MKFAELAAKVLGVEKHVAESNSRIAALEAENTKFKATVSQLETKLTSLQTELETVSQEREQLKSEASEAAEKIVKLEADNDGMKDKLENPEKTIQTEASKQAQTVLAKTGTPPVEEVDENGEADGKSIVEKYRAMTNNADRRAFLAKNFDQLARHVGAPSN